MENNTMDSVRATFTLNQGEFIKATLIMTYRTPVVRLLTLFGITQFILLVSKGGSLEFSSQSFLSIFSGIAILMPGIVYFSARTTYKRNRFVQEEKDCTITEERLIISSSSSATEFKWSDFQKFTWSSSFLFFYISKRQAIIVPTRALTFKEFRQVVQFAKFKVKHKKSKLEVAYIICIAFFVFLVFAGLIRYLSYITSN